LLGNFAKINDKKLKGSTDSVAIFLFFSWKNLQNLRKILLFEKKFTTFGLWL
jgi:hypothetical protein